MNLPKWVMPLQKAPQGLLELFRLRDGGRQPQYFGDVVEPSVEVRDFYGANLLTGTQGSPTVGALLNLLETVELGVSARVRALGAMLTVGAAPITAGGFLEVGLYVPIFIGTRQVPLGSMSFGVAAAGQVVGYGLPFDIVLPPGCTWYARAGGTAAGADHSLTACMLIENYTGSQG